ncbi:MAG: response regulator, partial [Magnetococcales bacterium]|nr:response regulator [Magnetococcales bacterium]
VQGDPARLRQIFLNLLSNAVKFTELGTIRMEANCVPPPAEALQPESTWIAFRVIDTGIGIAQERLTQIFEHFVQADSSITRRFGGTGLGLSIVKRLVETMGGTIQVESLPGQGTTFICTIPFMPDLSQLPAALPDLGGIRILVADARLESRMMLREYLTPLHAGVDEAEHGIEALRILEEAAPQPSPYRLMLLDVALPDLDTLLKRPGWRAVDPELSPVLMFDSNQREQALQRCMEWGCTHYLIKPVRRSELLRILHRVLGLGDPDVPTNSGEQCETRPDVTPSRILLVDDSEENRMLIRAYLAKTDVQLYTAENGMIALNCLQNQAFDLVLMDMSMPVMDGYTATRSWRRIEQQQERVRLPIIALTAHAMQEDIWQCLNAGCDAHLSKPVKKKTLIEMIERHARTCIKLTQCDPISEQYK